MKVLIRILVQEIVVKVQTTRSTKLKKNARQFGGHFLFGSFFKIQEVIEASKPLIRGLADVESTDLL